jgi:hypothetical protein
VSIFDPLLKFLKQGMSPERLALCVAIGGGVGNIPFLGLPGILCAAIALAFRLNLPAFFPRPKPDSCDRSGRVQFAAWHDRYESAS